MESRYDVESDILFLKLAEHVGVVESEEVASGVIIDFDERNQIVGIVVLDAKRRILDVLAGTPSKEIASSAKAVVIRE